MILILAASGILAIAFVIVAVVRRRRVPGVTGLVGVFLLIASLGIGLSILPERPVPEGLASAIGVLPPPPDLPRDGRGFAVALATNVANCSNPVRVKVVAAGTSEYWADYHVKRKGSSSGSLKFVLVLPSGITGSVQVGLASSPTAITDPVDARFGHASDFRLDSIARRADETVVTGAVMNWPTTLLPLLAVFRANWLTPRGVSTCYLRLPPLSGSRTATAVTRALGGCMRINAAFGNHRVCSPKVVSGSAPYVRQLLLSYGESIVTAGAGDVASDLSVPPPATVVGGNKAWVCNGRPDTTGGFPTSAGSAVPDVLTGRGGGAAYSLSAIQGTAGGSCRAVAVITENSAAYSRDLIILVLGAVIGLGITLLVQASIDLVRHGEPDRPDAGVATTDQSSSLRGGATKAETLEGETPKGEISRQTSSQEDGDSQADRARQARSCDR